MVTGQRGRERRRPVTNKTLPNLDVIKRPLPRLDRPWWSDDLPPQEPPLQFQEGTEEHLHDGYRLVP